MITEKMSIKELSEKMREGEFTLKDYVQAVYPPPKKGDPDYGFYAQWGYDQWIIKTQHQSVDSMMMFLRQQYNQLKMLSVVELSEENDMIKESSLKGLPIVRANKNIQQFPNNSIAKEWLGLMLWEDEEGKFCLFRGTRDLVARTFEEDEVELIGEEFENYKQFSSFSSNTYFPNMSSVVGKRVEIDGRVGEIKGHQKGFKPYNRYEGMFIIKWEDTGKEQEVMAHIDNIRRK